ncbi:MAG TPA: TonB-dependent receptor, partial [Pseudoduganella sp.]
GEYREPLAGISKVRVRASFTDYRHDEIEGAEVATRFTSKAHDARLELEHKPVAGWRGVVGLQTTRRDFAALGEEAYVPATVTTRHAAFVTEEYRLSGWRFEAGLRHEWQDIDVDNEPARGTSARGTSLALGAVWQFAPAYSLRAAVSRSHRLPGAEELYADGMHLATSTWEIGNEKLTKETSNNLDITLRKFAGPTTFSLSAFRNRIDNYIHARTLDNHEGFQLVEYAQQDATFTGIEGEVRHELSGNLQATLFGDVVRAKLRDGGGKLPRIPAGRIGAKLDGEWHGWHGMAEVYRVATQDEVAAFETRTPGYNMLNLGMHYNTRIAGLPAMLYARLDNVTDELAFSQASFIKAAAPLPGRNLAAGVRLTF